MGPSYPVTHSGRSTPCLRPAGWAGAKEKDVPNWSRWPRAEALPRGPAPRPAQPAGGPQPVPRHIAVTCRSSVAQLGREWRAAVCCRVQGLPSSFLPSQWAQWRGRTVHWASYFLVLAPRHAASHPLSRHREPNFPQKVPLDRGSCDGYVWYTSN